MSSRRHALRFLLIFVIVTLVLSFYNIYNKEESMKTLVLFSAISGKVLENGKPIEGAVIERSFLWGDEKVTDKTTTAADGAFALSAIERKQSFFSSLFPSEPFVEQTVMIH